MKKSLAFVVSVCLVAVVFAAQSFSAATKQKVKVRHISEDVHVDAPGYELQLPFPEPAARYRTVPTSYNGDCFNIIPDPELDPPTEHDQVGTTWYEFQKNGSMGRMISVTPSGYRHISWMWTAGVYPGVPRAVYARTKPPAGVWSTTQEVGLGAVNSGYSNQAHLNDGTSVVIFHRTGIGGNWSYLSIADGPAADPVYARKWDLPDDMPEAPSGEVGGWPKCDVLYCVDSTVSFDSLNYIHLIENESNVSGGALQWIGYLRCYVDPSDSNNLKCQTPTTGGEVYNITANTAFQDEVYGWDFELDISAIVVTGRGVAGRRVAIPYMPLAVPGYEDYFCDVAYIECLDNGRGWIEGYDWPPTIHKITNFGMSGYERAYHDLSACYDYHDSLHIVYVTCGFDPADPGFYRPGEARLYHWSKRTGKEFIATKIQEGANPGAHNLNIAKPSISAKDPVYHPDGDSIYLFCVWTQVDSSDQNAAGDQGNGDLFGSGSFDGGNTWATIYNLTGTHTPGCVPGDCLSEHWPSLAQNMYDGDLHIEYVCDKDAGGAIMNEGAWTENPVMYMRLPEWEVWSCRPGIQYRIIDPPHWYHPPIKVLPNQTRTIVMKMYNACNRAVLYSVTSDHPCIQVNIPQTPLEPKDSVTVNTVLDGTGACEGTFIAGNVIIWTELSGGTTDYSRVHAVVSEDYYECPRDPETVDTLENDYLRMYVNASCQQWIHDIGFDVPLDTTHEVFFQGGTIVATTSGGDTLVGRYMGQNDMCAGAQDKLYLEQCEPDWEPHFWIVYTKDVYIEAANLDPPAHQKWWWWEIAKQIKFFKPGAPEEYQRIVIKYVRVKRKDPPGWWPDQTPFTSFEDTYVGFAMDIDAPWDTSTSGGGPEPNLGDESALNYGRYDDVNEIAYVTGFGRAGEHPEYLNYHAGVALAEGGTGGPTTPYATANVKNNYYLYPRSPWGWKDGELYQLAAGLVGGTTFIQDPDSIVDRNIVLTASKIDAGTNPDQEAQFTLVEVLAPGGEAQMQALVDTARAIVAREREQAGLPAICGDCNGDFIVDVGDVVCLISYLFRDGSPPKCPSNRADINSSGVIDIGDVVYLVGFLYKAAAEPSCPGIWY
ncbi:MAG: dockerin type I repeat-containing protein [Candidatus Zixiibacteriota bacterium]